MPEHTNDNADSDSSSRVHWMTAKKGLREMFWIAFISTSLDATYFSHTNGITNVTHHTMLSRSLLLLTMLISGHAYYTVPQKNRDAWRWGFLLPWLTAYGIALAGLTSATVAKIGWPLAAFIGVWTLLVWLGSRSWRRSWRGIESMVTAPQR